MVNVADGTGLMELSDTVEVLLSSICTHVSSILSVFRIGMQKNIMLS